MNFNVFFRVFDHRTGESIEVSPKVQPVDVPSLSVLLGMLVPPLAANEKLGVSFVCIRVEQVAGNEDAEYHPISGENMAGQEVDCAQCGGPYPRADLVLRRQIACRECRIVVEDDSSDSDGTNSSTSRDKRNSNHEIHSAAQA